MQSTAENKMGVMPIGKLVLNMSVPLMISMLVQALYNVVDSVFVSMVSEEALSAVSFSFPAQNLMIGLATGTAVGVNALVSRALGAGDRERANRVAEHGVFLSLVGYVVFLLFGLFGSRAFMLSQTHNMTIVEYGVEIMRFSTLITFFQISSVIYMGCLRAAGDVKYTLFASVTSITVVRTACTCLLVLGLHWGLTGVWMGVLTDQSCRLILAYIRFRQGKWVDLKI